MAANRAHHPEPPTLLTIEAAAAAQMSMSTRYVRRLIAERRIRFYRLGRAVRIDPADLVEHITSGRIDPLSADTIRRDLGKVA